METADPPAQPTAPQPRRRLRFSLRTLLIATPILAALFAWIGSEKLRHDRDQAAAEQIRARFDTIWSSENGRWNVLPTSNADLICGRLYLPKTRLLIDGKSFRQPGQLEESDWKALGNLVALDDLKLRNMQNRSEGETFSRLDNLDRLELHDAQLTPDDFRQITELTGLMRFEITDFKRQELQRVISATPPSERAKQLPANLFDLHPLEIAPGSWPQMKALRLSNVQLSDRSFVALSQMENLDSLWILDSEFEARSLDRLADHPSLKDIHLWSSVRRIDNKLVYGPNADQQTLTLWGQMPSLENLHLASLEFADFGGRGENLAQRWPSLTKLSLSHCTLSPTATRELLAMPKVQTLSLDSSSIEVFSFADLPPAEALLKKTRGEKDAAESLVSSLMPSPIEWHTSLCFCGERFDDQAMLRIAQIPQLTSLSLRDTKVTDRGIAALENHPTLKELSVENSPITSRALGSIARIPLLTYQGCDFIKTGVNELHHQELRWRESDGEDVHAILKEFDIIAAEPVQP